MYRVSIAFLAIYYILILALPFGSWGWLQAKHPGDLQNASVPITVILAMVSLSAVQMAYSLYAGMARIGGIEGRFITRESQRQRRYVLLDSCLPCG